MFDTLTTIYLLGLPIVGFLAYLAEDTKNQHWGQTLRSVTSQSLIWPLAIFLVALAWIAVIIMVLLGKTDRWLFITRWVDWLSTKL